jgi:hypothetical protein
LKAERSNRKPQSSTNTRRPEWITAAIASIILSSQRKVAQGINAAEQYAALNEAREKRKERRQRNIRTILSGGYKQIPIIKI